MEWSNPASTPTEDIRNAMEHMKRGEGSRPLIDEVSFVESHQPIRNERDMSHRPLNA